MVPVRFKDLTDLTQTEYVVEMDGTKFRWNSKKSSWADSDYEDAELIPDEVISEKVVKSLRADQNGRIFIELWRS